METEPITFTLASVNNTSFHGIRELSEEEFDLYSGYVNSLRKLSSDDNLFRIVELNYSDLKEKTENYVKNYGSNSQEGVDGFEYLMLDVNRLILNFLSAIRTYLDHTETRLKREYGDDSEELKIFKTETSKAYDENFAYRFLYKLRNYSQHCGLPSGSISFHSTGDEQGKTVNSLTLSLVRDELLSRYDSWGTLVKDELKNQEDLFDIIPLIEQKAGILKEINKRVGDRVYSKYRVAGEALLGLMFEAQKVQGAPCLMKATGTKENLSLNINWFPFEGISKATGVTINVIPQSVLRDNANR